MFLTPTLAGPNDAPRAVRKNRDTLDGNAFAAALKAVDWRRVHQGKRDEDGRSGL